MTCKPFVRRLSLGAVLLACAAFAAPAFAQGSGSISGSVIGTDGKPAANAQVLLVDAKDASKGPFLATTGADGKFVQPLPAGNWMITVKGGKGYAEKAAVAVTADGKADAGDIKLRPASAAEATKFDETVKALIAKHNEKVAKQQAAVAAADAAAKSGNFDDAIAKYGEVADVVENCGLCYIRIGDIYRDNKNDMDGAEKAYKKAIELNDAGGADAAVKAGAYNGLAAVYNKEKKFDEASQMSAKAADLSTTDAAGGGDATALYNAGISLWNASKYPEAQAQFQKAVKIDPKMAEAYYYLAMTEVNLNKLTDAKPNLEMYLKLAPDGPNAATAKAVLESIK